MNISLNFAERAGVSVNHPPCCRVCNDTVAYEYLLVEKAVLCDIFKILYPVFMSPWLIWTGQHYSSSAKVHPLSNRVSRTVVLHLDG